MFARKSARNLEIVHVDGGILTLESFGTGPTTLFVHGLGEGRYVWRHLLCHPDFKGRQVSYDLRGHGDSSWNPQGDYTIEQHVDDLQKVLHSLPNERVIIVGHSMGGEIALRASGRNLSKVCGLILVDCSLSHAPEVLQRLKREQSEVDAGFSDASQFRNWLSWNRPLIRASLVDQVVNSALTLENNGLFMLRRDPRLLSARVSELNYTDHNLNALDKLRHPLLLLRGAASSFLSVATAQAMIARAKCAEMCTVPSSGHGIALENPEGLIFAITPFLSSHLFDIEL